MTSNGFLEDQKYYDAMQADLAAVERERDELRTRLASVESDWLIAHKAAVEAITQRQAAEAALASVADCVNQELRESGGCDHKQAVDHLDAEDIKRAVKALMDANRRPR